MKKVIATIALLLAMAGTLTLADAQTSEFKTAILSGTADVLIDSSLTTTHMSGKRLFINGIYAYYDNGAAQTNPIHIQIVRGTSALRVAGSQRVFRFAEAMADGGFKAYTFTPNITADGDSAIYFVINAASSDSLFMAVSYKLIN